MIVRRLFYGVSYLADSPPSLPEVGALIFLFYLHFPFLPMFFLVRARVMIWCMILKCIFMALYYGQNSFCLLKRVHHKLRMALGIKANTVS